MHGKKTKYYVVWEGRQTGIFTTWEECSKQTTGYPGAKFKAFESREAAQEAFLGKYDDYKGKEVSSLSQQQLFEIAQPVLASYAVDASCIGNPGPVEYRCVSTETKEEIFKQGPFEGGTNNIGEFLALVHARYSLILGEKSDYNRINERSQYMSSTAITTVVKMLESLPEPVQAQIVEHLREYIEDLRDELEWDAQFEKTTPQLTAAAKRAKQEMAQGQAKPLDYERFFL